jgi:hypothetical protein
MNPTPLADDTTGPLVTLPPLNPRAARALLRIVIAAGQSTRHEEAA